MPAVGTLDNTIGLLYDTVVISAALYGAGLLQAWFYFRKFSGRDNAWIKGCVTGVLVCDTVQMILLSKTVYVYLVTNHGNDLALGMVEKTLLIELYFSGTIAILTQAFYAWRIFALSKSFLLAGIVMLLSVTSYVFVYTSVIINFKLLSELVGPLPTKLSMATNSTTALCDIAITLIMIIFLERSKTGFRKSTDMLNRLIIFVFNTGMPTTICAILSFAMVKGEPNTFLYIMFYLIMGRFYTNSILVTLNSRDYIRNGSNSGTETRTGNEISLHTVNGNASHHPGPNVSIRIETDRVVDESDSYGKGGYGDAKALAV
ncbi:hypothetical protein CYLTODRAFT_417897 [Cylindrobasidium torrendii FP15055 ss-10]|uniref:DUF6534 domain-containing protein n=1 Tax=Cylindrobasidium torrendii FP15055 ss-10 TaxID=1314674 RepID=A0A0D7BQR5_9AGAR|nr:hypothetical protein CYLTODRAFT_417897 [Cylindrobasidium torrendii FP15055 ss-10]